MLVFIQYICPQTFTKYFHKAQTLFTPLCSNLKSDEAYLEGMEIFRPAHLQAKTFIR